MKSEIRQDYIHNRVVIIAPGRNKRPHDFQPHIVPPGVHKADCPFCPDNESKLKIVTTYKRDKMRPWSIRAIKNIFPAVSRDNPRAYGDQEVIIETPDHDVELAELPVEHIAQLIEVYGDRIRDLAKDKKIQYIMVFKNNGGRAGASIDHAHSQIFATNFLPPHVLEKLKRAEEYRIRYGHCYYCDHFKREAHSPRLIHSDDHVFAETPYASSYNYEAWIFPKRHVDNVALLTPHERLAFARALKNILIKLNQINLPYNIYLHQVVRFQNEHLYFRIAPRRDVWAGIELGSRLVVNTVSPEEAATFYRGPEKMNKVARRKRK